MDIDFHEFFFEKIYPIIFALMFIIILFGIPISNYYKATTEAKIYNSKYNTKYTAWDFILARDTILDYVEKGKQSKVNLDIE